MTRKYQWPGALGASMLLFFTSHAAQAALQCQAPPPWDVAVKFEKELLANIAPTTDNWLMTAEVTGVAGDDQLHVGTIGVSIASITTAGNGNADRAHV